MDRLGSSHRRRPCFIPGATAASGEASWWLAETHRRIRALVALVAITCRGFAPVRAAARFAPVARPCGRRGGSFDRGASALAADLDARIARASTSLPADSPLVLLVEELRSALGPARERLKALARELQDLSAEAMRFATEMDFGFLMDRSRLLLSIGYEIERQHLHQACYDLLCSEARIAAFITVAKGEAPAAKLVQTGPHPHHGLWARRAHLLDGHHVRVPDAVDLDAQLS
jgi:cyclic beta-1,2-glucan synthetase